MATEPKPNPFGERPFGTAPFGPYPTDTGDAGGGAVVIKATDLLRSRLVAPMLMRGLIR